SDFHLGKLSLNARAVEKAVAWGEARDADLVAITGDLVTRRRGEPALERAVERLSARRPVFAVLGNHDVAESRDPFVERTDARRSLGAALLADSSASLEARGVRIQVAGVDPAALMQGRARPEELADPSAALRILLCHFPEIVDRLPPGAFQLVLAGHTHGGQLCVPIPGGKLRLEHLGGRYWEGVYRRPGATLYVSRGLGTSFVPFRFLARPQAIELVLRRA
ncbi:MAG TPA: metallophosphoesterase, partial [Gaiellaceae bacterium]|nr:metallophosphoesterase [Gaiellaceae bacterium]